MPKIDQETIERTTKAFKKAKILDIDNVVSLLKCSKSNARLKLKQWKAYTSYNRNGRYYTLPDIPRFDVHGLWHFNDIYFSKHGTLRNTFVYLVRTSTAGITGHQIGEIVKISPRSFLHHFRELPSIRRQKHGGVFVYFSDSPDIYKRQLQHRLEALKLSENITDTDAIDILVAIIKHHEITIEELAHLPEIKGRFSLPAIRDFMDRHGLLKKTLDTNR